MIRSPFDGIVTEIHFRPGEFIASESRQLITVVRLQELRSRFYLLAETASRLSLGQTVKLKIGERQVPVTGTIAFISPHHGSGFWHDSHRRHHRQSRQPPSQWLALCLEWITLIPIVPFSK